MKCFVHFCIGNEGFVYLCDKTCSFCFSIPPHKQNEYPSSSTKGLRKNLMNSTTIVFHISTPPMIGLAITPFIGLACFCVVAVIQRFYAIHFSRVIAKWQSLRRAARNSTRTTIHLQNFIFQNFEQERRKLLSTKTWNPAETVSASVLALQTSHLDESLLWGKRNGHCGRKSIYWSECCLMVELNWAAVAVEWQQKITTTTKCASSEVSSVTRRKLPSYLHGEQLAAWSSTSKCCVKQFAKVLVKQYDSRNKFARTQNVNRIYWPHKELIRHLSWYTEYVEVTGHFSVTIGRVLSFETSTSMTICKTDKLLHLNVVKSPLRPTRSSTKSDEVRFKMYHAWRHETALPTAIHPCIQREIFGDI